MKNISRLYFNPVTKELELEGSEEFIKTYFDKLQGMLPGAPVKVAAEQKAAKELPVKKERVKKATIAKNPVPKKVTKVEITAPKKVTKAVKEKSREKKGNLTASVIELIKGSPKGITLADLIEKSGLTARQIISITSRVAKEGKIKRAGRGTYIAG